MGTIFLDEQLLIKRFTPASTQVINLIQTDVGRPVNHIVSNLVGYEDLVGDVTAVLDTLIPREVEVQTQDGSWYLMRILPYRTLENVIEGAVITFTNMTELRRAQEGRDRLAAVAEDSFDAVLVQDLEGRVLAWNPSAKRMYGWSEAEALRMNVRDIVPEDCRDEAAALVERVLQGELVIAFQTKRETKDGDILDVSLTITKLVDENGQPYALATTEKDVSG